jgi:hypothetical protein
MIGLARPQIKLFADAQRDTDLWGVHSSQGLITHIAFAKGMWRWKGMQGFQRGDVVGLMLGCDAGTLIVKKNGVRLEVAITGLAREFRWAATLFDADSRSVRVAHNGTCGAVLIGEVAVPVKYTPARILTSNFPSRHTTSALLFFERIPSRPCFALVLRCHAQKSGQQSVGGGGGASGTEL